MKHLIKILLSRRLKHFQHLIGCLIQTPQLLTFFYLCLQVITWFQNRRAKLKRDMEELRKDVEFTSQTIPSAMVAGHPHQVAAAAAVAASVLASRNAAAAAVAVSKYNSGGLDLHRSPPPQGFNLHAAAAAAAGLGLTRSEGAESSTSLISPRSPPDSPNFQMGVATDSRSPPIRVTDSDG